MEIFYTLKKFCLVRKSINNKKKLINATKILNTFKRKRVDIVFTKLDTKKIKSIFEKLTRKIKKTKFKFKKNDNQLNVIIAKINKILIIFYTKNIDNMISYIYYVFHL